MAKSSKVKLSMDHVLKGLDELRNQELLCDVHLVAEGAKFPAHRVVLAAASPYFRAMFTGGFKENQMCEITLNDMTSIGIHCVLNAIYTAELSLSEENVCDVLPVASQLQLTEILSVCDRFLVSNVSPENCLSFLSIAEKYDLVEVVDVCNEFVLENFSTISQLIEFKNITKQQLCSYLSNDQLKAGSGEIEVFRATLEWFEANRSAKEAGDETDLADLMQYVRFPLIPSYSLLNEIMTSQIISKNPEVMRMVSGALLFHSNDKVFLQPLQEGKYFQPRGEQMLALIHSTSRRAGQSYTTDDTKLHMIRGTGDNPFHTEVSQQVLPMTLHPLSLCVVTQGNYLFLFGADANYFRARAVRFDVKTNT